MNDRGDCRTAPAILGLLKIACEGDCTLISRSEEAPESVFHPRDESGKINCDFLRPFWCNIKVDPER